MNEKFNLHFDMSGSSGDPMSSRHMNRSQARQVIRENIIRNCILHRNDEEPHFLEYIVRNEINLGHKIPFYIVLDDEFENFMGFQGAFYWLRQFGFCMKMLEQSGTEATPLKTDVIFMQSVIIISEKNHVIYHIVWDTDIRAIPNPIEMVQNASLIDELDKNHNMLEAIVDGYMWAQDLDKKVEKKYKIDPSQADAFLIQEAAYKYGNPGKGFETTISDNGLVDFKAIDSKS